MPDWSLFFQNVWEGFCVISYVLLVLAGIAAIFILPVWGIKAAWDWYEEYSWRMDRELRVQEHIKAQEEFRKWMKDNNGDSDN